MRVLFEVFKDIILILFIEAIIFSLPILLVLTTGDFNLMIKYLIPYLIALIPYLIFKKIKVHPIKNRNNIILLSIGILISVCYLCYYSWLVLACLAGHYPY